VLQVFAKSAQCLAPLLDPNSFLLFMATTQLPDDSMRNLRLTDRTQERGLSYVFPHTTRPLHITRIIHTMRDAETMT
jgi:hypothetical protein